MFSKQRLSRGPQQPTNSSALAAASAIGRALDPNGKVVDKNKLPEYNGVPNEIKRSSSFYSSRRNSFQPKASSGSRNNSLGTPESPNNSLIEGIRRRTSIREYNSNSNGGSGRSYSLQSRKRPPSRNNSVSNRRQEHNTDPQITFQEFGGQQAAGIIHRAPTVSERPKTIKKYLPSSRGLVAVEVPVEDHLEQQRKISSLRRSSSTNSLSQSRNNSLIRRSSSQMQSHPPQRRHSSLTNNSIKSSASSNFSSRSRPVENQPLIQTYLQEETEQELRQDVDVIRPLQIPRDKHVEAANTTTAKPSDPATYVVQHGNINGQSPADDVIASVIELEKEITQEEQKLKQDELDLKQEESAFELELKQEENSFEEELKKQENLVAGNVDASQPMSLTDSKKDSAPDTEAANPIDFSDSIDFTETPQILVDKQTEEIVLKEPSGGNNDAQKEKTGNTNSEDEMFDASDDFDANINSVPDVESQPYQAPSLAQHLRAVNPYLHQRDNDTSNDENETDSQNSKLDVNKNGAKSLYKIPSPMKSALKKTNTQSSATSSIYSENSPANQAYLSLTTAENTRLNAKLASSDNLAHRQTTKHLSRPQSMVNSKNNRSSSPSPGERNKSKRLSNVPKQTIPNRNSLYKTNNDSNTSAAAAAAAKTSASVNNARHSSIRRKALEQIQSSNQAAPNNRTEPKKIANDALYPKEPPQKRSSFEKNRNQETHLGFKKLSLRDEYLTDAAYEQSNMGNNFRQNFPVNAGRQNTNIAPPEAHHNLIHNSGWKSRIHDSDSDDDTAPFSSAGTGRSTLPTTVGTNVEATNGGNSGFSLFKHKGKPHNDNHNLAPPQAPYMEGESVSANTSPNKVNKKWSRLSLRSSSTGDAYEQKQERITKTSTPEKRFHSNSKLEGFNYDKMKERSLRPDQHDAGNVDVTPKKKKNFGKKLKKLFGRN